MSGLDSRGDSAQMVSDASGKPEFVMRLGLEGLKQ
jgi:hypothetical protein